MRAWLRVGACRLRVPSPRREVLSFLLQPLHAQHAVPLHASEGRLERARALRKNVEQHYVSRQPPIEPSECIRTNRTSVNSDCWIASLTQQKASAYAGFAPSRCAPGSTALAGAAGPVPPELHGTASSSRQAYAAFLVHQKTPSLFTTYKFHCRNIYRSVRQSQPANSQPRSD